MARDEAYQEAERRVEAARQEGATELNLIGLGLTELPEAIASLTQLQELDLSRNKLTELPEAIASLTQLQTLNLSGNQLMELPEAIASLTQLQELDLCENELVALPEGIGNLTELKDLQLDVNELVTLPASIGNLLKLESLSVTANQIRELPESISQLSNLGCLNLACEEEETNLFKRLPECLRGLKQLELLQAEDCCLEVLPNWLTELTELESLYLVNNHLTDVPASLGQLLKLKTLSLRDNPLNPDLAAAYGQGIEAVKQYLRARLEGEVSLHEAKLILVGEGEVGKSCLLGALRGDEWVDGRPTTHGIEIKPVIVTTPDYGAEITLNGWDFWGQRVYRPTHQLFFSCSAVYLVVWKPREGPQQGFVKEWITLIKHREPDAKVLVVATHGGPGQRQPDIDRQELIDIRLATIPLSDFSILIANPIQKPSVAVELQNYGRQLRRLPLP